MAAGIEWTWETFPEYLDFVEATPKGINYAGYLGHSALRTWAMGEAAFDRGANTDELALMLQQLRDSLHAGAIGFTTSISYNHETADDRPVASRLAEWSEIDALVSEMGRMGAGIFELAHHGDLRSRDAERNDAYVAKIVELGARTRVPITYGMLAPSSEDHHWKPVLKLLDGINAAGGVSWGQAHTRVAWAPCCRSRPRCRSTRCRCGGKCGRSHGASNGLRCETPRFGDASSTRPRTATTAERSVRRPASPSGSTSTR